MQRSCLPARCWQRSAKRQGAGGADARGSRLQAAAWRSRCSGNSRAALPCFQDSVWQWVWPPPARWKNAARPVLAPKNGAPAKLGGILIELAGSTGSAGAVGNNSGNSGAALAVIGIGINLDLGAAAAGIDQPVTDLAALGVRTSRNALLAALLETLLPVLRMFEGDGFAPLAGEWNRRHAFANRAVVLSGESMAVQEGIAIGADGSGALLLETTQGVVKVVSGEVSLRMR
jgi:Biotin protein ligase C terminal domain